MPETINLSHNIRNIRKILNISQIEFAADCGISTEILSLLERGKTDPKLSTIQKISAYVGCETVDLLTKHNNDELLNYIYCNVFSIKKK